MLSINFRDARPLYEQICSSVRRAISTGLIQPGEKLPSVRELAAQLAINPNTIQRAYRTLEDEGWIISSAGRGSFASEVPVTEQLHMTELYEALDAAVRALTDAGVSRNEISEYIRKGDETDA